MQRADLEREKQRANEELAGLLTELVIEPIDSRLEARTKEALIDFEGRLEEKLKKQFAAVGKVRDLDGSLSGLSQSLEDVGSKLRMGFEGLSHNLVEQSASVHAGVLEGQSKLRQLLEQLDVACKDVGQASEQSFAKASVQLEQHIEGLRLQLVRNEKAKAERASQLHAELEELAQLSSTSSQHISSAAALLSKDMSALLEQSSKSASGLQRMQAFMEQQQLLMAAQQLEIQRLQHSLRRISWFGLVIGLLIFGAVTLIALQTPVVAAFLGLES
jgi:hypothetical protein